MTPSMPSSWTNVLIFMFFIIAPLTSDLITPVLLVLSSNEAVIQYSPIQFCAFPFLCSCLISHSHIKSNISEFYFEMIFSVKFLCVFLKNRAKEFCGIKLSAFWFDSLFVQIVRNILIWNSFLTHLIHQLLSVVIILFLWELRKLCSVDNDVTSKSVVV